MHVQLYHSQSPLVSFNLTINIRENNLVALTFQLTEDSVIGLPGTRVLSRVVVEHTVELEIVPTRHQHTVEQTA